MCTSIQGALVSPALFEEPLIYASAENNVKARLFSDLVRGAVEEYSYDAELAGLQNNISLDSRGWRLHQLAQYSRAGLIVEELAAELSSVTFEGVRLFQEQMLGQVLIEVYVHGNMYREDALKATDMVESIMKPRVLPKAQWPILRSLIVTESSNYVFRKTIKYPANVNHCVETWFYVGSREDRDVRTKTRLLDQMLHEPAFDQLRTKEQLGYVFLDSRIEAFLMRYADTLEKMSKTEFEDHKRSLIVRRLEKLIKLDQESQQNWSEIESEEYDFEFPQRDAARIRQLTKAEIVDFFNQKKADEKLSPGDAMKTAEEITDVGLYKAGLAASSGARSVKDITIYNPPFDSPTLSSSKKK
ncbi:Metalloenzyme, LuxS/M16 peptidase-like protein [Fusarium oxysporum]|nr:Metalloenzyme, LuxS/M16 peptidase-like protein [Fusarium oxysporum]